MSVKQIITYSVNNLSTLATILGAVIAFIVACDNKMLKWKRFLGGTVCLVLFFLFFAGYHNSLKESGEAAQTDIATANGSVVDNQTIVYSIALEPSWLELYEGQNESISAKIEGENIEQATLHWESSNTNIVYVDQSGNVQGVGGGTATITVSADNDLQASCEVTVNQREEEEQEIQRGLVELLDQDYTLELNETDTCSIFVPENGRVTINVRTYFDNYHYVYLKDRNRETVDYKPLSGRGVDFPETASFKYDLCAGEYSVVIESINDCWGDYHISASYVPSITGAKEITNVDFRSAQEITGIKTDGFVSSGYTDGLWSSNIPETAQVFENYYYYEPNTSDDYVISVVPISDEGHFL